MTNKCMTKLKLPYTNLPDSIKVITFLYEITLEQPMVDKKFNGKEASQSQNGLQ